MGVTHSIAYHTQHTSGYSPLKSAGQINNQLELNTRRKNICENPKEKTELKMSSRDLQYSIISSSSTSSEVSSTSDSVSSSSLSQTFHNNSMYFIDKSYRH